MYRRARSEAACERDESCVTFRQRRGSYRAPARTRLTTTRIPRFEFIPRAHRWSPVGSEPREEPPATNETRESKSSRVITGQHPVRSQLPSSLTTWTTVNTTTRRGWLARGTTSRSPFSHDEATAAECWLVLMVVPVLLLYPPRIYYTANTDTRAGIARAQYLARFRQ